MAVPWLKIIQWVPSILDLSRELLHKSKLTMPPAAGQITDVQTRVLALEENEQRQAELVARMAEQSATLSEAITVLHRQLRLTQLGVAAAAVFGILGFLIALLK